MNKPVSFFNVPGYRRPKDEILSETEALTAQSAAAATARGLYDDARLLLRHGRIQRAAALAILALEEVGKIQVLARVAGARDDAARKAGWKEYVLHRAKAAENVAAGVGFDQEKVREIFSQQADALKQLAFYSNWLDSGDWTSPESVIDAASAELAVQWAGAMVEQLPK